MNAITPIEAEVSIIKQLPIGIHFNVPDEIYFAQNALGSTDRKALVIDPVEYQFERLHGENKPSKEKTWGSALHSRVLEGVKAYKDTFGALSSPESFDDLLVTVADLKGYLDSVDVEYKKSGSKDELINAVLDANPSANIWDVIKTSFDAKYPEDRRLDHDMASGIETAANWMQASNKLAPFMENGTFKFGAPEVTVIYEIDGVRLRARFDYVLPGVLIDLKTYRPWRNTGEPVKAIVQAIGNFRYDLQSAAYEEAFSVAHQFWLEGKVYGDEPYEGFLQLVFEREDPPTWLWIMVKGSGAPRPRIVEFPQTLTVFKTAQVQVRNALTSYKEMMALHGPTKDWQPDDDVIVLDDTDFPAWFGIN